MGLGGAVSKDMVWVCSRKGRGVATDSNDNGGGGKLAGSAAMVEFAFLGERLGGLVEFVQRGRTEGIEGAGDHTRGHCRV